MARGILIVFCLLCFFSFFGCTQKKSIFHHSASSLKQNIDQIHNTDQMKIEHADTSEQMCSTDELYLTQLLGIQLPIGFKLHKDQSHLATEISNQSLQTSLNFQPETTTIFFPFSETLLNIEKQNNQHCFTAQGIGNKKELFSILQKLLAQSGWNVTYEYLNQIGIIKAKKASLKTYLIIRTHDFYHDQSIIHYIIQ